MDGLDGDDGYVDDGYGDDSQADASGGAQDGAGDAPRVMQGADAECGPLPGPNEWSAWVMPNPARSGLPNPAGYTVSPSGNQVTDRVTKLVWQRSVGSPSLPRQDAEGYCACLTVDGVSGWRLPSRIELASIADWTTSAPAIDTSAFPNTPSSLFWTSSPLDGAATLGYLVDFNSGFTTYAGMGYPYGVRCVRSSATAPAPANRYMISAGTVYDTQTKLTWQQVVPTSTYAWADAKAYCSALSLGGTGWRLPSISEFQTIVNDSTNPAVDGAAFPMTPSEYFWSSSPVVEDASSAWACYFANGSTYKFPATKPRYVRCVR
jgi:hypothetical protein